jgi:hypothetical protein
MNIEMIVTQSRKNWIINKIYKYCKQLGVAEDDYPSTIIFSAKDMNVLYGYKPTDKTTSYNSYNRNLGKCMFYDSRILINVPKHKKGDKLNLLKTIVHEVLHYRFCGLNHNNPKTRAKFETIVNLVLKEDKTDKDLVYESGKGKRKKNKFIVERKDKPLIKRYNGNTFPQYSYTKTSGSSSKIQKVYYKVQLYKGTYLRKTKSRGIVKECPALQGHLEGYPDIKGEIYSLEKEIPIYEDPIKGLINSVLRVIRNQIRYKLYDNDESIDIILEYDTTKDYQAILKPKEI